MPPKFKVTREMIVDAGVGLIRESGIESVNTRALAERLGCSTQPVLYSFRTVEEVKRALYDKIDAMHTEYLMNIRGDDFLLGIGLNYIRFAVEEPNFFRFLFQSGFVAQRSLPELMDSPDLEPMLSAMGRAMGTTMTKTKEIFLTLSMFAHGYASILANNSLKFNEKRTTDELTRVYRGAVLAAEADSEKNPE